MESVSLECQRCQIMRTKPYKKELTKALKIHQLAQALETDPTNYLHLLVRLEINSVVEVFLQTYFVAVMMIEMKNSFKAVQSINVMKVGYSFHVL